MVDRHITFGRMGGGALAFLLCLAMASAVAAQGRGRDASERKKVHLPQHILEEVDVAASTIRLGGETYQVAGDARLFDEKGRQIQLRELAVDGVGEMVEYRVGSVGKSRHRMLRHLAILDGAFELP